MSKAFFAGSPENRHVMTQAFISAGSNIEPDRNIRRAVRLLASRTAIQALSTVYAGETTGKHEGFSFSCVIEVETSQEPRSLRRDTLLAIKAGMDKKESVRGLHTIDLDLLLYGHLAISEGDLILPHPIILQQPFLILALYELAPDMVLPGTTVSVASVAKNLRLSSMKPLLSFTALLQQELRKGFKPAGKRPGHRAAG